MAARRGVHSCVRRKGSTLSLRTRRRQASAEGGRAGGREGGRGGRAGGAGREGGRGGVRRHRPYRRRAVQRNANVGAAPEIKPQSRCGTAPCGPHTRTRISTHARTHEIMVACADVLAGESVAPLLAVAALLLPRPALREQPTAGACMVWYGMVWYGPAAACAHMHAWPAARGGRANLVPPRKDELELERARVVRRERHEPLAPTIPRRVGYQ